MPSGFVSLRANVSLKEPLPNSTQPKRHLRTGRVQRCRTAFRRPPASDRQALGRSGGGGGGGGGGGSERPGLAASFPTHRRPLRIALATLLVVNSGTDAASCEAGTGVGCALLPWCAAARRLQSALGGVAELTLLLITGESWEGGRDGSCPKDRLDLRDCPGLRIEHVAPPLAAASRHHVSRVIASGVMSYDPKYMRSHMGTLYKWDVFRLVDQDHSFDALLFTDIDVDVMPHDAAKAAAISAEWAKRLPPLLARARRDGLRYVGYGDLTSPLVAGMFWVLPSAPASSGSRKLYEDGLRVLRELWDAVRGFNRSGTPVQLFRGPRHGKGQPAGGGAANGGGGAGGGGAPSLLHLGARWADWTQIDSGDIDQGLLLYMVHYRHRVGGWTHGNGVHRLRHFVRVGHKPWRYVLALGSQSLSRTDPSRASVCCRNNLRRQAFLWALYAGDSQASSSPASACARGFAKSQARLATLNVSACCEDLELRGEDPPPDGQERGPMGGTFGYDMLSVF